MTRSEILRVAKQILFNTDMVRAILDGRKTVTRRRVKYKYSNTEMRMRTDKYGTRLIEIQKDVEGETYGRNPDGTTWHKLLGYIEPNSPYKKGDYLYVRETYKRNMDGYSGIDFGGYIYKADCRSNFKDSYNPWHPSIHMPKEAARIFLRVTDVRVERLREITETQTEEEGFQFDPPCLHMVDRNNYCVWDGPCTSNIKYCDMSMGELFGKVLWNPTIKKSELDRYGWDANPWVWVIEFERVEPDV